MVHIGVVDRADHFDHGQLDIDSTLDLDHGRHVYVFDLFFSAFPVLFFGLCVGPNPGARGAPDATGAPEALEAPSVSGACGQHDDQHNGQRIGQHNSQHNGQFREQHSGRHGGQHNVQHSGQHNSQRKNDHGVFC
mmetsp:Transcript_66026/g.148384  ORF Transcript_66026/g.148384 Transcript_66026/m.148384 type:complete len:135 (+) Transcript_66026:235-639(+)